MGIIRILQASAGSGKTFTLAYQYIKSVIEQPRLYREILAVTFTNKATEEMKQRIVSELALLSSGQESKYLPLLTQELMLDEQTIKQRATIAQSYILHDYSRFAILTIDKFFQRIIRSFIKELGIDLNFNIELKTQSILEGAADSMIEQISSNEQLRDWIVSYIDEKIELGSRWDIKNQLIDLGNEIFKDNFHLLEGKQISKQELQELIKSLNQRVSKRVSSMQTLAQQIIQKADQEALSISDFAYGKTGIFSYIQKTAQGEFITPTLRVHNAIAADKGWVAAKSANKPKIEALIPFFRPLLIEIVDIYEQSKVTYNSLKLIKENYRNFALLSDLATNISKIYTSQNILHITETNRILRSLISGNDTPFIFEKVGNTFSKFMIDEFQDTSQMQWDNFIPLLHNSLSKSDQETVLLVGDIKQSIYRWRGGDWQILANKAASEFEGVMLDNLKVNYRSEANIVRFNNAIIDHITRNDNAKLNAMLESSVESKTISKELYSELKDMVEKAYTNHSQQTKNQEDKGYVNISFYDNKQEQEPSKPIIIERIEQLQEQGYSAGDTAILVRTNAQASQIASMLLDYKRQHLDSKYCYDVVTSEALTIGSSPMVNFVVSVLRLSLNTNDTIHNAIFNNYLGKDFDTQIDNSTHQLLSHIKTLPILEAFESVINHFSLGSNNEELAYLQALHQQVISYCSSNIADTLQFCDWWQTTGLSQSINIPQSRKAITIISIHKSKGLEFRCVILPYCNWSLSTKTGSIIWSEANNPELKALGKFPVPKRNTMQESFFAEDYIKEEILSHIDNINTFYVAATRACEQLHIMIPKSKSTSSNIHSLIAEALSKVQDQAQIAGLQGLYSLDGETEIYEFGSPTHQIRPEEAPSNAITSYPTREPQVKLHLRQKTQRYYDSDQLDPSFSPRNYGILMHRLFENSRSMEQIILTGESMQQDRVINAEEWQALKTMISVAFENPIIHSWFNDSWDEVRTESQIILPHNQGIKRPDRVMMQGNTAVVVDYKFGLKRSASHHRQIKEYGQLLESMGYSDVKCYLWYVSIGDIELV